MDFEALLTPDIIINRVRPELESKGYKFEVVSVNGALQVIMTRPDGTRALVQCR